MTVTFKLPEPNSLELSNDGGIWLKYDFDNGYTASVIRSDRSYGGLDGLWELAVLKGDKLCYDTPVTGDVLGYLTPPEVLFHLNQVKELPHV